MTGVSKDAAIRVPREFADNAAKTRGRSLNIIGAGLNHWYNNDTTYRPIMNLGSLCGCHGVNGGGWAHYVGQEKLRPAAGWSVINWASDWTGPYRPCQGTTFFYWATDSWRHELIDIERMSPEFTRGSLPAHPADCNVIAARLGWMPHYPQFRQNSLDLCSMAEAAGAKSNEEIVDYVVRGLKDKTINLSIENPDAEENVPRVLFCWRVNALGSFVKGHEYMLRYMLGTTDSCLSEPSGRKVTEFEPGEPMEQGKLDLLVSADFRMTTSCLHSDVVLPSAHWYEYDDLSTTDFTPFINCLSQAVNPPWETRDNWTKFDMIADAFLKMAEKHLGKRKDIVATPPPHDGSGDIAQPFGEVKDWSKGECEPIPGKTMFDLTIVGRDYANLRKMYSSLGPNVCKADGVGGYGVSWSCAKEHDILKSMNGQVQEEGISKGMPRLSTLRHACEAVLALSPETNGPACVASCPSGALYKRDEDGIVLADQTRCRSWRRCMSACPYKKVYLNWKTHRSEKCIFCYPRIEEGKPTLCAQCCPGRIRYVGVMLYDVDKVSEAAASINPEDLCEAQLSVFVDPNDDSIAAQAVADGVPWQYVDAAKRSPVYKMVCEWQIALPLHPEFRTLPMVWYVPPLSPLVNEGIEDAERLDNMRIPVKYLANLLAAGDEGPVRSALGRLMALRSFMRSQRMPENEENFEDGIKPGSFGDFAVDSWNFRETPTSGKGIEALAKGGLTPEQAREMYRLLAIARYEDRFVVPTARVEHGDNVDKMKGEIGYPEELS